MNCENFCFGPNKAFELIDITDDDVLYAGLAQQQRLNHAQAIRHVLRAPVGPCFVFEGFLVEESLAVLLGDCRRKHLLPDTVFPLASLCS